jgi:hypothetical protein
MAHPWAAVAILSFGVHLARVGAGRVETVQDQAGLLASDEAASDEAVVAERNPIHVAVSTAMRNNRGGGGFGGRTHRPPRPPPAWQSMPLGCDQSMNLPTCFAVLFFESTKDLSGISGRDYCINVNAKAYFTNVGSSDKGLVAPHYQCYAAATDSGLQKAAEEIKKTVPQDEEASYATWKDNKKYKNLLAELSSKKAFKPMVKAMSDFCYARVQEKLQDGNFGAGLKSLSYGFCRSSGDVGQDCQLYKGIKDNWKDNLGKKYCEGLYGDAGKYRCLSLRKQFKDAAGQMHSLGASWVEFEDISKKKTQNRGVLSECS